MTRIIKSGFEHPSPHYRLKTSDEILRTEWNLTKHEKEVLTLYCLRNWNASELLACAQVSDNGRDIVIRLWDTEYLIHSQCSAVAWSQIQYLVARGKDWPTDSKYPIPKFWLSFRQGIGFAYVIIQEDRK